MPITIPIEGASEAPSETILYACLSSIDLASADYVAGRGSIDVLSDTEVTAGSSIDIQKDTTQGHRSSISVDNYFTQLVSGSLNLVDGDQFLILADLIQAELTGSALGGFAATEINAKLSVNDVEVAIKAFSFQAPTGRLGSLLNVTLADPDVSQVPDGADIKFELEVVVAGVGTVSHTLIENGKLQERDYTITYRGGQNAGPQDQVTFGALDVIADKFSLAPRRPVIMYDPNRVKFDDINYKTSNLVRSEDGSVILPVIEPVYNLSMKQILSRAYTGRGGTGFISTLPTNFFSGNSFSNYFGYDQIGCGFDRVITNITDYKVRRVDFTLEGGWHDGATPTVAMYAPVYFVDGTTLFILDPDKPLPYGVSPHTITLGDHRSLSERIAFQSDQNAVLLTYQYAGNDPTEDPAKLTREVFEENEEIIETEVEADGVLGGYTSTTTITTRRWTIETYMADAPTEVLASYEKSSNIETRTTQVWVERDGTGEITGFLLQEGVLVHQETSDYQYYNELKIGHQREIKGAIKLPDQSIALETVEREETEISWTDDPYNPGVKIQDRSVTRITGRTYHDPESDEVITYEGGSGDTTITRPVPILAAQASGAINSDYLLSGMVPIKTIRETLRNMAGRQFDVEVLEIDHLNNTVKRSRSTPVTGNASVDPYETRSRNILFRNLTSEAEIGPRVPVPVNAYELPRTLAILLARQVLYRLEHPLTRIPVDLPGVDFAIARGTIIRGQTRSGYTPNHFVTGYTINGQNLGQHGHRISQSLETIRLATEDELA